MAQAPTDSVFVRSRASKATPEGTFGGHAPTVAVLVLGDLAGLAVAGAMGWLVTDAMAAGVRPGDLLLMLLFVGLAPLVYAAAGLYPGIGVSAVDELRLLSRGSTWVGVTLVAAAALLQEAERLVPIVVTYAAALVLVPLARSAARAIAMRSAWWGVPVVIFGAGRAASLLVWRLQHFHRAALRPVAAFDDDPGRVGGTLHGVPIAGRLADAASYRRRGVQHVLVAIPSLESDHLASMVRRHAAAFPSIIALPDMTGLASMGVSARSLGGLVGLHVKQNLLLRRNLILKRLIDLVLLVPAAVVAVPVVAIAALLVMATSPGRPFFAHEREGRDGRRFRMWKLRTMHVDADARLKRHLEDDPDAWEEWNTRFKLTHDPRVVRGIGSFLRKTSLDELPQLWNVARGEMSFVGPRPFPEYHLAAFDGEFRELRARVRPGLTGLWQVMDRSEADLAMQKELDSIYIANWSPWMDLYVLARTPVAVLKGRGAY